MLDGKIALITGGASGLGRTLVDEFVQNGAKVVFTYKTSESKAKEIEEKYGDKVMAISADATDYEKAIHVVTTAKETFDTIDILINNAASAKDSSLLGHSYENWDYTIKNVLYPTFNYTKAVSSIFKENNSGKIISIGSINGLRGREGSLGYSAAKSALVGFTKTVAKELGSYNVNCNLIAPGYIDTDGQINTSDLIKKMVLDESYIRKLSNPESVANLVIFLSSEKADNITGEIYKIDCGQYM